MATEKKFKPRNILDFVQVKKRRKYENLLVVFPRVVALSMEQAKEQMMARDFKEWSELSITFKPSFTVALSPFSVKDKLEVTIKKCLQRTEEYMCKLYEVNMLIWSPHIVLIAEHGPNGDHCLHYHGIIKGLGNDIKHHLLKILRAKIGRTYIRYIQHEQSYKEYMFKSYEDDAINPEMWSYHSYIEIKYGRNEPEIVNGHPTEQIGKF